MPVFKTETISSESIITECSCDNSQTPVGAHFGARTCLCEALHDPDLQQVIAAWPTLPTSIQRAVVALVASQTQ